MNFVQWKLSKEYISILYRYETSLGLGKARLTEVEREKWEDNKGEDIENSLYVKMSPGLQFQITLHGFLLWASMGFLMPVGILAIRLSNREKNPKRHRILFYVHSILQASISY